jgi:hypothetical protein
MFHMGLDVYVGSVTRYLCGDWETTMQKHARDMGMPLRVIRPNDPPDAITDPVEILPVVLRWRESLSKVLENAGGPALDWDESPEAPYFTDKPDWEPWGDLMVWAAYVEKELTPPTASREDWYEDPVVATALTGEGRYRALVHGCQVWLPMDFDFPFRAAWVNGSEMVFGSAQQLARDLDDLSHRSFRLSARELEECGCECKENGDSVEMGARFALSVFSALATEAIQRRLVMKLDY